MIREYFFYANKTQYILFREFWVSTFEKQFQEMGYVIPLIPLSIFDNLLSNKKNLTLEDLNLEKELEYFYDDTEDKQLFASNLLINVWLSVNCPIDFIQNELKNIYDDNWVGFKHRNDIDFKQKPCFIEINNEESSLRFYLNSTERFKIPLLEKILVIGTPYIYEFMSNTFKKLNFLLKNDGNWSIYFNYYGLLCLYENNQFYIKKELVTMGRFDFNEWILPKITINNNMSEIDNHNEFEIYFSNTNKVYPLTDYVEFNKDKIKNYINDLPKPISYNMFFS